LITEFYLEKNLDSNFIFKMAITPPTATNPMIGKIPKIKQWMKQLSLLSSKE
jgi:hypothetical protein